LARIQIERPELYKEMEQMDEVVRLRMEQSEGTTGIESSSGMEEAFLEQLTPSQRRAVIGKDRCWFSRVRSGKTRDHPSHRRAHRLGRQAVQYHRHHVHQQSVAEEMRQRAMSLSIGARVHQYVPLLVRAILRIYADAAAPTRTSASTTNPTR
jgi:hypothetical protein